MTEETSARIGWPERRAAMRRFARAAATFDGCDAVHTEARNRLLERLGPLGLNPRRVLDLGSATGKATARLAERYPDAQIVSVDLCGPMAERTRRRCRQLRSAMPVVGDAQRLPLATDSMDLVFANLVLPWCDPRAVFAELARVLRDGGLALFSSVGPDTLCEVRRAWAQVDGFVHVHGFVDMHDLGDLMARAGLAEPVVDVDRLRVTYRALPGLVSDLRGCGASNVAFGRPAGLTGRARWRAFADRLEAQRVDGVLPMSVELIFGQAWGAGGEGPAGRGTVTIAAEELARGLRRGGRRAR